MYQTHADNGQVWAVLVLDPYRQTLTYYEFRVQTDRVMLYAALTLRESAYIETPSI
jgi:hypothetical protein